MYKLANLGIQKSRRFQFYSDSLKLGERVNAEIWGSPGSRQLLHLQQFPKILKKIWTLLYFELVSSFLDFSLLIFGLWILKSLPALWVTVNRLVLAHFNVLTNPILS